MFETIEIQFDKYSRPKFIVNFQLDPPSLLPKERPWPEYNRPDNGRLRWAEAFRLHPQPNSIRWFGTWSVFGWRSAEDCARKTVDRLMELFPEVEAWFKGQAVGRMSGSRRTRFLTLCDSPGVLGRAGAGTCE